MSHRSCWFYSTQSFQWNSLFCSDRLQGKEDARWHHQWSFTPGKLCSNHCPLVGATGQNMQPLLDSRTLFTDRPSLWSTPHKWTTILNNAIYPQFNMFHVKIYLPSRSLVYLPCNLFDTVHFYVTFLSFLCLALSYIDSIKNWVKFLVCALNLNRQIQLNQIFLIFINCIILRVHTAVAVCVFDVCMQSNWIGAVMEGMQLIILQLEVNLF